MPAALREFQYELSRAGEDGGLVFGTQETGYLTLTRPVHNAADQQSGDSSRPSEDGIMFGRDYLGAKSVSFEIAVLTDRGSVMAPANASSAHRLNLDYLDALEGWWLDERIRTAPKAYAMLRACEGGVVSRTYGRPRRYDEIAGTLTRQGYTNVVCDFQMMGNLWFADTESMLDLNTQSAPEGGLVAPLVAPLTTTREAIRSDTYAEIGGSRPTWLSVEFMGPALNPTIEVGGLTIGVTGQINEGESYVITPQPWTRGARRSSDGASVAGALSKATPPMAKMLIRPGTYQVRFRATNATGEARARLRWRSARSRP